MTKKSTKSALLTSSISLLLCFAMLLGTTFAWFTDSVTSANNIIKSGNLDIELDYWNGTEWKTVQGASDILTNQLWEPGVAEVAYLKLTNKGSLALKYQLGVNIASETAGVNVAGDKFKLSDYIYFDVVESDTEIPAYTRDTAMAVATETTKISKGYTKVGEMKANSQPLYLAMIVHMPTTVGNEANHNGTDVPQIDLGINVFATQVANESEKDSFDEFYDNLAFIPVADVDFLDDTNITLVDDSAMDLDVAYSFKTTEDDVAAAASGYRYWHADFVVSASQKVKANSMALAGYYEAYAQFTGNVGKWIALIPDTDVDANTQIRLMELMGVTGNYEELCDWIPEFLCGAKDLDGSNSGNTLTVELRLYETYSEEECLEKFGYKSKNEETGEYITIGVFEHTFGGEYKTLADGTLLFITDEGETFIKSLANVTTATYTVPVEVTALPNKALNGNTVIKEVTVPATVTDFGGTPNSTGTGATGGFFYKSAVEKVTLSEGLTQIPAAAFNGAANLKEVNIPSTVTSIGINAFASSGLTELNIPEHVTNIGYGAFRDMANLKKVTITGDDVHIPAYAFRACANLTEVYLKVNTLTLGDNMIFTNTSSNNENPNNITIYVYNEDVKNVLVNNNHVKCNVVLLNE